MVPHRGARGRAISVYPTPWPPTCSGVLPSWCTIEVAALLVVTEEAAILDVPGRLSHTCTCQRRGKRWDHSPGAGVSHWYKGSYSMHNPALLANALFLLRGQMVAYYHGWATVPRRERAATCPHKKTSHALGDGSFRLGTHDARTSCIPLNGYKLQCVVIGPVSQKHHHS